MVRFKPSAPPHSKAAAAFTLAEVLVSTGLLGIVAVALFTAFLSGLAFMQLTREDQRATQILMQKMETIRLFTWTQSTNAALATPTFTDFYDPAGAKSGKGGTQYQGYISVTPMSNNVPADYRSNLRLVTVTLYWTNHPGQNARSVTRCRQMQTCIAQRGMQNYIY